MCLSKNLKDELFNISMGKKGKVLCKGKFP